MVIICHFALVCVVVVYFFYKGYRNGMVVKAFSIFSRVPIARRWLAPLAEKMLRLLSKLISR